MKRLSASQSLPLGRRLREWAKKKRRLTGSTAVASLCDEISEALSAPPRL